MAEPDPPATPDAITVALRRYHAGEAGWRETTEAVRPHAASVADWLRTAAGFFADLWGRPKQFWPVYDEYAAHIFKDHQVLLATVYGDGRSKAEAACPELRKFHFHQVLGEGLSGEVWRATAKEDGDEVAVKSSRLAGPIHPDKYESRVIAAFNDEQVVRHKYTFVTTTGRRGIVMELLRWPTLAAALTRNQTGFGSRAVGIVRSLLAVVGRVHDHGYLHNDLKPGNLFLTDAGEVIVGDFGSASPVGELRCDQPSTPYYRAPERYRKQTGVTADLFSCACVAFEVLTGRRCLQVDEPNGFTLNEAELAHVPEPYQAALRKALAADPAARYQRADHFRTAFPDVPAEPPPGDNFVPAAEPPAAGPGGQGHILVGDVVLKSHWGAGFIVPLPGHDRLLARIRAWLTGPASDPGPANLKVPLFWIGGPSGLGKSMALQAVLGRLAAERDRTAGCVQSVVYLADAVKDWPRWLEWCQRRAGGGRVERAVLAFDDDRLAARGADYRDALSGFRAALENGNTGWLPRVIACGLGTNRAALDEHCHDVFEVTQCDLTQTEFDDADRPALEEWLRARTGRTAAATRGTPPVLLASQYQSGESAPGFVDRVLSRLGNDPALKDHVTDVLLLHRLGLDYPTDPLDDMAAGHVRRFNAIVNDGGLFADDLDPVGRRLVYRFTLPAMIDLFLKKLLDWPRRVAAAVGRWVRCASGPAAAAAGPDALARCVADKDAVWSHPALDEQLKRAYHLSGFGLTGGTDIPLEYIPAWVRIQAGRTGLNLAPAPLAVAVKRLAATQGRSGAGAEAVVQALLVAYREFKSDGDRAAVAAAVRDHLRLSPDDVAWRNGMLDLLSRSNDPTLFRSLCEDFRTNTRGLHEYDRVLLRRGLQAWVVMNGADDRGVAADLWDLGREWLRTAAVGEHDWGYMWPALWDVARKWFPAELPTVRQAGLLWLDQVSRTSREHAGIGYVWPPLWVEATNAEPVSAAALDRLADVAGQCLKRMPPAAPAVGYIWPRLWDYYGPADAIGFTPWRRDALLGFATDWLTACLPTHGGIGHVWPRVWDFYVADDAPGVAADHRTALVQLGDEFVRNRPCDDEPMIHVWERLWDADPGRALLLDKAREFLALPLPDHKDWSHVFNRVFRWLTHPSRADREAERGRLQRVATEWLMAEGAGDNWRKNWPHVFRIAWWHAGLHIPPSVIARAEAWLKNEPVSKERAGPGDERADSGPDRDAPAANEVYGTVLTTLCDDTSYPLPEPVKKKAVDWLGAVKTDRAYWGPVWLCVKDRNGGTAHLKEKVRLWLRAFARPRYGPNWHSDWPRVWLREFDGKPPVIPSDFVDLAENWLRAEGTDGRFHNAWPEVWVRLFGGKNAVAPAEFVALALRWVQLPPPPHRAPQDLTHAYWLWEGAFDGLPAAERWAMVASGLGILREFSLENSNWQFLWLKLWRACGTEADRDELRRLAPEWLTFRPVPDRMNGQLRQKVGADRVAYGAVLAEMVWGCPAEFHTLGVEFLQLPNNDSDSFGLVAAAVLASAVPESVTAATAAAKRFTAAAPKVKRGRAVPDDIRSELDPDTNPDPVAWQVRLAVEYWERGEKMERNTDQILTALDRACIGGPLAAVAAALRHLIQQAEQKNPAILSSQVSGLSEG